MDSHTGETPNTIGTHGMLVFGTQSTTYFSHLPMFMSPHNFQVLLEVDLDDESHTALAVDRHAGFHGIHTFDPEVFPITELDPSGGGPKLTSIRGSLVHGHFERGGRTMVKDAVATVRNVVWFGELAMDEPIGG
ncbi:hypothetical protein [Nocardia seriolae]|uniref:Uncharacterized protein n=1 Tax=Nocardia seriolae TaxID=37332 RepID=A0A0B8NGJ1_9NOCA|nr:hypothetical protein [Nocardia seriolae]MTJ62512.1 hypothetical protein [Nocardia seriolae]MTJ72839.1 hypothetical protein [Nocardia seriolae]MTJ87411.1 hypothetical protein [Nocardia seriolae]MTK31402.1 hypothetical protein [Nocardia seriolae]MTK40462.1 hypothetical protein [Nocardia seriolae]